MSLDLYFSFLSFLVFLRDSLELELLRLRFFERLSAFTTSGSLSEDDLPSLDESSSESLELEFVLSLLALFDFWGLGVLSCLVDFFGFSSRIVSNFLPSTLSALL